MGRNLFLALIMSPFLLWQIPSEAQAPIPADPHVLQQSGQATRSQLPALIKILVWNIQKAQAGEAWQNDFLSLSSKSDLVLLQEGYRIETFNHATSQLRGFLWSFVTSFFHQGYETGVVIGSPSQPLKTFWLRSPGREPFVDSPKMTILSEFDLPERDDHLLVANIHAINFVTNGTFYEQITPVLKAIEQHRGPVLFAGDFNTWNSARFTFVETRAAQLGLKIINFPEDPRRLVLDHVFYRGLKPQKARVLNQIESSDHFPLHLELSVEN